MTDDATGIARAIAAGVEQMQQTLPPGAAERLARLLGELARWNRRVNLTAIREPGEMVAGHILDSLSVRRLLAGRRLADVGTGAGFPGLPLAIAEPQLDVTLVDSNGKKIGFVRHMIGELGLENATAVKARVERYVPDRRFDTVVARAFAPLARTIALSAHLLDDAGVFLALKGKYPDAELAELEGSQWNIEVRELTVPGLSQHARHVTVLKHARGTRA